MKSKILFAATLLCIVAGAMLLWLLPAADRMWALVPGGLSLILLLLLWRGVVRPASVAMLGMELISAQDFNNRLRHVGERNADRVVTLFNSLIDKLHNERLLNMEQQSFLSLLIEASPMGVMMLDFDGKVSLINRSMLRLAEIADEKKAIGTEPEKIPSPLAAKMAEVPLGEEMTIRCGDARMFRCYHLCFMQRGFRRRFYLLESLTEEVMKAEREAYEKVIRIISHEVNNTMGGVQAVLGMLSESADDPEMREVIESCDDRCSGMCSFIRAYAEVVKLPEPDLRRADLAAEIRAILPFLRGMAGNSVSVEASLGESPIMADFDAAMIQQTVVNIVKNAVESIRGEGKIVISAGSDRGHVWLDIANDGEPISEEVSKRLFSPFFTTKREGRGLGLTLIAEILRRHNARFSLLTGDDGITRFHIEF